MKGNRIWQEGLKIDHEDQAQQCQQEKIFLKRVGTTEWCGEKLKISTSTPPAGLLHRLWGSGQGLHPGLALPVGSLSGEST